MNPSITGLHHVTAIASDPQCTLDFYVGLLGLRFVKHAVALSRDIVGSYFFRAMAPLVPETQPNLSSLRVWIGGGEFDPIIPASETRQLVGLLRDAGADVTIRFLEGGHELTRYDVYDARKWLTTFE